MLKMLLSSAISALAVFVIMSFGASGQTVKPTPKPSPEPTSTNTITSTEAYPDSKIFILDIAADVSELIHFTTLSAREVISGTYSEELNAYTEDAKLRDISPDMRSLWVARNMAFVSCAAYADFLKGDTRDLGIAVQFRFRCSESLNRLLIMLFDKADENGMNLVPF